VNQREKEAYLREYSVLKAQGKPFFPYSVAKDGAMAAVTMALIIGLTIVLGAEMGPKADPTSTTIVPRPEWYFFFLFELLRVIKPAFFTPLATIGIPMLGMILLLLLPFYDRSTERRPERRPVATVTGILAILAMGYLTYAGAVAGSPGKIELPTPKKLEPGKLVAAQAGCTACHKFGESGNVGPGPNLTHVAKRLAPEAIARTLRNPTTPMPPYGNLPPEKFKNLVDYLGSLK
jgi:menaquinol-cytochrome c reductase cytochrome b/c subunit